MASAGLFLLLGSSAEVCNSRSLSIMGVRSASPFTWVTLTLAATSAPFTWAALAELGYLHGLVAGHGSMLAVMLLVSLACKCALSWLLLHYLFFSAWPVTHLSYPAGRQPSGVLLGVLAPSPISLYFVNEGGRWLQLWVPVTYLAVWELTRILLHSCVTWVPSNMVWSLSLALTTLWWVLTHTDRWLMVAMCP